MLLRIGRTYTTMSVKREIPKKESGNLDKFLLSNEELIYKKELDVLALLRYIHNKQQGKISQNR